MLRLAAITQINDLRKTKGNIPDLPHMMVEQLCQIVGEDQKTKCGPFMQVKVNELLVCQIRWPDSTRRLPVDGGYSPKPCYKQKQCPM